MQNIKTILKKQIELIKPDSEADKNINLACKTFCEELNRKLKKKKIKADVKEFRKDFQGLHYCFKEGFRGYDYRKLI